MSKPLIALTLFAAAQIAATGPATAQSAPVARISHADLDLARPADRRALDRRLAGAVEKLCPPLVRAGQRTQSPLALRCRADTEARTQLQRTRAIARATAATVTADSR